MALLAFARALLAAGQKGTITAALQKGAHFS